MALSQTITPMKVWTTWRTLQPVVRFTSASLAETLDEGQAFRWQLLKTGQWEGVLGKQLVQVRLDELGRLQWRTPKGTGDENELAHYFDAGRDYVALIETLPWRSDAVLARALACFPGIRILRQSLAETLLVFLCSSTKQIAQIKLVCEALAEAFGESIAGERKALPDWATLAKIPEEQLRKCGMGYRARFIAGTAAWLAKRPGWLEETARRPYREARERLMELPGVGGKIADCVLLYGVGKLEAFPVDTWVLKAMTRHYQLDGWKAGQIAHFGREHFGLFAGVAQQYLFSAVRRGRL